MEIWGPLCFCRLFLSLTMELVLTHPEPPQKGVSAFDTSEEKESSWMQMLSIETGGIQRVTDEERQVNMTKFWNACTFWYDPC